MSRHRFRGPRARPAPPGRASPYRPRWRRRTRSAVRSTGRRRPRPPPGRRRLLGLTTRPPSARCAAPGSADRAPPARGRRWLSARSTPSARSDGRRPGRPGRHRRRPPTPTRSAATRRPARARPGRPCRWIWAGRLRRRVFRSNGTTGLHQRIVGRHLRGHRLPSSRRGRRIRRGQGGGRFRCLLGTGRGRRLLRPVCTLASSRLPVLRLLLLAIVSRRHQPVPSRSPCRAGNARASTPDIPVHGQQFSIVSPTRHPSGPPVLTSTPVTSH